MSKRNSPKNTKAGLRYVQAIGSLAVPGTLEKVPEEVETKPESLKPEIFATDDWNSIENSVKQICRKQFELTEPGTLYNLHQNVKNVLRSRTGTFLNDCYKEWLSKEFVLLAGSLRNVKGPELLNSLEEVWTSFYSDTLPLLEGAFYLLKPRGRLSVRGIALAAFRDIVFFAEDVEGAIHTKRDSISPEIRHAILILQNVNDSYPPCKNRLRLESLAAQICSPFMGYFGIYENGHLVTPSNEPATFAKRRPSADVGPRRISRPFSVQPQQMDTLNQLFKKAIRQRNLRVEGSRR
ncbi:proline-rich protein 5 [Trichonephila clavata]|uniref:Proline-rich protein 5 n=1 Tax=Trichonephila clavata TaxID=2740835 RepID=A0A8X6KXJ7_TRICU|nr:proline-rich protein 5 [Trichonephila clavata]